jgi:methionyl-tRNA formyltransferase
MRAHGAQVAVVVAYGLILPQPILDAFPLGAFNLHASLLPRWRGAAPINRAIMAGDAETGVMVMKMEEGLDTGPVFHRVATPIGPEETAGVLTARLAVLGAAALTTTLALLTSDSIRAEPQDGAAATYASKIEREMARLDWSRDPNTLVRQVRAFDPSPGAWTTQGGYLLKLFGAVASSGQGTPGTVLAADERLLVACGDGAVAFKEVQVGGKNRIPVAAWSRGRGVSVGERFV